MYTEEYEAHVEVSGMESHIIEAVDVRATPPVVLQKKEEPTVFEALLRKAVTPEEHLLVCCIEELLDEAWRFATDKDLRGELRRMFTACGRGYSERRFYAAFHGIEKRIGA